MKISNARVLLIVATGLLLICLIGVVEGASIEKTLIVGESFEFQGKNITLMAVSLDKDKAFLCVNGESKIIYPDDEFMDIDFKLRKIRPDYVEMRVIVDCDNCKCGEECSNQKCLGLANEENITGNLSNVNGNVNNNANLTNKTNGNLNEKIESNFNWLYYFSFALILIVVVLLIIVLVKKKNPETEKEAFLKKASAKRKKREKNKKK